MADWGKGEQVKGEPQGPEPCSGGESGEERPFGGVGSDTDVA